MVVQTIIHYLESNKRLVIPQLGAFIVKVPGQSVVFSEMLRNDDGVLRGLLCAEGMSELAAAGAIDRFVFEARRVLQSEEPYAMFGFGRFHAGLNGTITFEYDPRVFDSKPESGSHLRREESSAESLYQEPKISPSPVLHPDPSIKGLRYGKPEKGAFRYSSRPVHRGFDTLLFVAILASVIALATIAYVYIRDAHSTKSETELVTPSPTDSLPDSDAAKQGDKTTTSKQ